MKMIDEERGLEERRGEGPFYIGRDLEFYHGDSAQLRMASIELAWR